MNPRELIREILPADPADFRGTLLWPILRHLRELIRGVLPADAADFRGAQLWPFCAICGNLFAEFCPLIPLISAEHIFAILRHLRKPIRGVLPADPADFRGAQLWPFCAICGNLFAEFCPLIPLISAERFFGPFCDICGNLFAEFCPLISLIFAEHISGHSAPSAGYFTKNFLPLNLASTAPRAR